MHNQVRKCTNELLVSVNMITYNHEKHIAQAIKGVVLQQTNFRFELVVGEDFSTDSTAAIVKEYAHEYPHIVKAICNDINLGMHINGLNTVLECKGKYIALCEGDDYWIDPDKLQMQYDFLEANPDYFMCHHRYLLESTTGLSLSPKVKETTTIDDLARNNHIGTLTCMFRNQIYAGIPDWITKAHMGDYPLFMHLARFGKIKFFDKPMAVYRVHPGGAWNSLRAEEKIRKEIEAKELMISQGNFSDEIQGILRDSVIEKKLYLLRSGFTRGISENLELLKKDLVDSYSKRVLAEHLILSQKFIVETESRNNATIPATAKRLFLYAFRQLTFKKQLTKMKLRIMLIRLRYRAGRLKI